MPPNRQLYFGTRKPFSRGRSFIVSALNLYIKTNIWVDLVVGNRFFFCQEGLGGGMFKGYHLLSKPVIDRPSLNHACKRANPAKVTVIVSRYNDFCQSSIRTCAAAQYLHIQAIA